MTVQFPRQAITKLSASLPTTGSGLVRRLVQARNDPGKERIRNWLIDLDDAQLQSGLGLTPEDIVVLRGGTPRNPRRPSEIHDVRTRYFHARLQVGLGSM